MNTERDPGIAERAARRKAERKQVLGAALSPGEVVLARSRVLVTEQRVLFAWNQGFGWRADAITFEEVKSWALGQLHDERPLIRIEHPTHVRKERVPAHRVPGFAWGNAEADKPHDDVTLTFRSSRDPSFHALMERLDRYSARRGADFVVAQPSTGEQRRASRAYLKRRG